ncbi:MAG: DUF302 domain-containing protein [Gammaproteobacteria bacterium]|nr:DUF302 domain-containing protein [Gammaproteobacteria bacterium]MDH5651540.1 DUF302 domain-containing protein [Gammaproteobacteria bacterium]
MKNNLKSVLILFLLVVQGCAMAAGERDSYMKLFTVQGKYENVRDDLELAITGKGIKINNIAHIGDMLERTGKDIGKSKQVFSHAEAFEFCNATISRATMEADPHNIVFCPYVVAVYSLPDDPNKTYIAYRRPQLVGSAASKQSLQKIENMLDEIIAEIMP